MALPDRLSPSQLTDPLVRARLYRDIRRQTPRVSRKSWYSYTVAPGEVLMPELVAYRAYRSKRLKWVVLAAAGMTDYRLALEGGETLQLPSLEWLRDRLRYYMKLEAVNVTPSPVRAKAPLVTTLPELTLPDNLSASEALQAALTALAEPTPLVSPADEVGDESLNRQRNAIDAKLAAVKEALAHLERK
ncbi:hypothetical protein [Vreelandella alkaliphila]|uniref:Uncharacterized protein n=1 Tax=Vreelandella alkaliphila TaxID=272774 RepID=A0AAJ2S4A4_9GAMM|nr:hypothetical protein [Halomonas alkaliphila]MDX5979629.1 hypothetical protein [Halomonas alkaliphila]